MFRSVTDTIKRRWDRLRKRMAIWVWDRPVTQKDRARNESNRIVFVRWDAKLGDTIVLSWVLRELQRQRPDLELTVVTADSFKALFVQGYGIGSVYVAGKRHGWSVLSDIAQQIRYPKYVVHLSLHWRPRDIRFVRKLAAEHVVGLDDEIKLADIKLGQRTHGSHFSDKLVPWLEQLGVDTTNRQYWLPRLPRARKQVDEWWPEGKVIGLCPYGASRKRRLSTAVIKTIVEQALGGETRWVLLIAQGLDLVEFRKAFEQEPWFAQVIFRSTPDLLLLFEQVARCDAVISVDTAAVHIASGFDLPLLALYASIHADSANLSAWHPRSDKSAVLIANESSDGSMGSFNADELRVSLQHVLSRQAVHAD